MKARRSGLGSGWACIAGRYSGVANQGGHDRAWRPTTGICLPKQRHLNLAVSTDTATTSTQNAQPPLVLILYTHPKLQLLNAKFLNGNCKENQISGLYANLSKHCLALRQQKHVLEKHPPRSTAATRRVLEHAFYLLGDSTHDQ